MPSRKSDQARKSDVSAARFVLADDHQRTADTSDLQSSAPPATPGETIPPAAFERPISSDRPPSAPSQHPASEKKDKEKERDREGKDAAVTIEDLSLPKSIITRLAKGVLPPNTQIQANAILAMSKGATVFINHLANAANEFTLSSNKKTVMPQDVFQALDEIDYGFMRAQVEAEFAKFNQIQTSKRSTYRRKVAAAKKAATGSTGGADMSMTSIATGDGPSVLLDSSVVGPDAAAADASFAGAAGPAAKKLKTGGDGDGDGQGDESRMEVDEEVSDAETVPDETHLEEEDEDDDEEEEEEEEEEDESGADEDGDPDGLEERENGREDEDEALDSQDSDGE